jgi:hypothetical protein
MYLIDSLPQLNLGRIGENDVTEIEIDVSEWLTDYPAMTFAISMIAPSGSAPFLVTGVTETAGVLTWVVGAEALQVSGAGTIVIGGSLSGVEKRSARTDVFISPGHFQPDGTPVEYGVASDDDPLMDGTAAPGISFAYSRKDHVHPSDTAKAGTAAASTSAAGLAPQATAPAAGLINVLGIANGETARTDKALFDATAPSTQAFGDAAAVGTAVVAARRDHKHATPAAPTPVSIGAATAAQGALADTALQPTAQTLTDAQKEQAQTNIGFATPSTTESWTGRYMYDSTGAKRRLYQKLVFYSGTPGAASFTVAHGISDLDPTGFVKCDVTSDQGGGFAGPFPYVYMPASGYAYSQYSIVGYVSGTVVAIYYNGVAISKLLISLVYMKTGY